MNLGGMAESRSHALPALCYRLIGAIQQVMSNCPASSVHVAVRFQFLMPSFSHGALIAMPETMRIRRARKQIANMSAAPRLFKTT